MQSLINLESAPFSGPFCGRGVLLDALATGAAPYEGLWVPTRFAKSLSVELLGTISSFSLQLYGTNADAVSNTYKFTVGGTITDQDLITLTFKNPLLPGGSAAPAYTVQAADTTTTIATGLAAAINANAALTALGFSATSVAAVVTVTWPSIPAQATGGAFSSVSDPQQASFTSVSKTVSGGATETITIGQGSDGQTLGAAVTALGLTNLNSLLPFRWVKARVTALTATSLSAYLAMTC